MEPWSGLDQLRAPSFDSELGVLIPEVDDTSFVVFVPVEGHRVKVWVDYGMGLLEEAIVRARKVAAGLPALMGDLLAVSVRQNRASWLAEELDDEGTPIGSDMTRELLPVHSVRVFEDEDDLVMEVYFEPVGLWSNHAVRTFVDGQDVVSSF